MKRLFWLGVGLAAGGAVSGGGDPSAEGRGLTRPAGHHDHRARRPLPSPPLSFTGPHRFAPGQVPGQDR